MKYIPVKQIEDTGVARGLFTSGGSGWWPFRGENAGTEIPEADLAHYRELAAPLGTDPDHMNRVDQKHTDRVMTVRPENAGEGVIRVSETGPCDGMITDVPGTVLCIVTADCVPVFLIDPVKKAAGLVHSGWKGTAAEIAVNAIRAMKSAYGTDPADLVVCLGPYICSDCYEVSDDLRDDFGIRYTAAEMDEIFRDGRPGHCYLDLGRAISISLTREGVAKSAIHDPSLCTYHSEERFFSWRRNHTKGKNVLSALMLK